MEPPDALTISEIGPLRLPAELASRLPADPAQTGTLRPIKQQPGAGACSTRIYPRALQRLSLLQGALVEHGGT